MAPDHDWRKQKSRKAGSDSVIAGNGAEYVVFDNAQVMPIYVIYMEGGGNS